METLLNVVTIKEAALMYYMNEKTVRYHLLKGHLTYRKTTGGKNAPVFIDGASLVKLWGQPRLQIVGLISTAC